MYVLYTSLGASAHATKSLAPRSGLVIEDVPPLVAPIRAGSEKAVAVLEELYARMG